MGLLDVLTLLKCSDTWCHNKNAQEGSILAEAFSSQFIIFRSLLFSLKHLFLLKLPNNHCSSSTETVHSYNYFSSKNREANHWKKPHQTGQNSWELNGSTHQKWPAFRRKRHSLRINEHGTLRQCSRPPTSCRATIFRNKRSKYIKTWPIWCWVFAQQNHFQFPSWNG